MKKHRFELFCIIISILLLAITVYRAATTGITYDEGYTYMFYVFRNPFRVFQLMLNKTTLANAHILNSFMISCFNTLFNASYNEFIIRIPNILFYIVYLVFSYMITKDTKYKYASFSLLALNYEANEFFGLGRGYGMATALVLVGLYFFKRYVTDTYKSNMLTLSYLFLMLACYANTASLLVFGTIIIVSFIIMIKNKNIFKYAFKNKLFLIPIIILTLLAVKYHFMVSSTGKPLYGGKGSFFDDVLVSLITNYGVPSILKNYIVNFVILLVVVIITKNFKKLKNNWLLISSLLFFIILVVVTKVTGNMWMTGRCLLPFMPLITCGLIEVLSVVKVKKQVLLQLVIIIPLVVLFCYNLDFKHTRDWYHNYVVRQMSYDTYESKDKTALLIEKNAKGEIANDIPVEFYRKKIQIEYDCDILE